MSPRARSSCMDRFRTTTMKRQAEQIVRSIRGVQNVQNQLQVAGQGGEYQTFGYVPGQTDQSQQAGSEPVGQQQPTGSDGQHRHSVGPEQLGSRAVFRHVRAPGPQPIPSRARAAPEPGSLRPIPSGRAPASRARAAQGPGSPPAPTAAGPPAALNRRAPASR